MYTGIQIYRLNLSLGYNMFLLKCPLQDSVNPGLQDISKGWQERKRDVIRKLGAAVVTISGQSSMS